MKVEVRDSDAIAGVRPRAAYAPATLDECAEVMAMASRERLRLGFVGGGTALAMGAAPTGLDAVVRTERLTRIVEHAPADMVAVVEAGVTLAALQTALAAHGQRLAIDPPCPERATIGGLVAAAGFGPLRARYGAIRDLIIGVTLVRADGTIARGGGKVVKNVAGFDLPKVACGSFGTLGMIATATFRLHPLPETTRTVLLAGIGPEQVVATLAAARAAQLEPTCTVAISAEGARGTGAVAGASAEGARGTGAVAGAGADGARGAGAIAGASATGARGAGAIAGASAERARGAGAIAGASAAGARGAGAIAGASAAGGSAGAARISVGGASAASAGAASAVGEPGVFDLGVRFEGFGRGVDEQVARLVELAGKAGLTAQPLTNEAAAAFWRRHDAVRTAAPLRVRVAALPTRFPEVAARLAGLGPLVWYASLGIGFAGGADRAADGTDDPTPGSAGGVDRRADGTGGAATGGAATGGAATGGAATGGAATGGAAAGGAATGGAAAAAIKAARAALVAEGGSLVIEEVPAELRSLDPWGPPPPAFAIMQRLKQRFDPDGRLNPGRFVGGL